MDAKEKWEIHDPKLPQIHGAQTGNGMEQRRTGAPVPQSLQSLAAEQNLSI